MLFLFEFFLISNCFAMKKMTFIAIDSEENQDSCLTSKEEIENSKQVCKDIDETDYRYEECQFLLNYEYICTVPYQISQTLKSIQTKTESIAIMAQTYFSNTIDFNDLPKKVSVAFMVSTSYSYSDNFKKLQKIKFDGSPQKMIELSNMKSSKNPVKTLNTPIWNIKGGIKSRVSFLVLTNFDSYEIHQVASDNGQIDCESLSLVNFVPQDGTKLDVTHLIVDKGVHNYLTTRTELFNCKQYHLNYPDTDELRISFYETSWSLLYYSYYNGYTSYISVPHSLCPTFGVISSVTSFDLYADYDSVIKAVNISVMTLDNYGFYEANHLSKQTILITKSGYWPTLDKKVTIHVTTNLSKYEISAYSSFKDSNVIIKGVSSYSSAGGGNNNGGESSGNGEKRDSSRKKKIDKITTALIIVTSVIAALVVIGVVIYFVVTFVRKGKVGNALSS